MLHRQPAPQSGSYMHIIIVPNALLNQSQNLVRLCVFIANANIASCHFGHSVFYLRTVYDVDGIGSPATAVQNVLCVLHSGKQSVKIKL